MKKVVKQSAVIILLAITVSLVSCIKKPADIITQTTDIHGEETPLDEEPAAPVETLTEAKVLSPKTNLFLMGRDTKMHGILNLAYGDNVSIISLDAQIVTIQAEGKTYGHSVYNEVEYWIDMDSIALQCENALVLEKAVLYADRDAVLTTDEKNSPFRFGDFICRSTSEEDKGEVCDRIYYFDKNTKKVRTAFIKKGCLSTRTDDIIVMDCVKKLKVTKRATPRNEIFKKAAKYNPCPKVAAALEAEKTEKIENNYQDVLNALPGAKYKVNVPELLTVDQSKDPFQ